MNIEDRVRKSLRSAVVRVQPSEDAWEKVHSGGAGLRKRRFGIRQAVAITVALGVAAGAFALAWVAFRAHSERHIASTGPSSPQPTLAHRIQLPEQTRDVTVEDDVAWAVGQLDQNVSCSGAFLSVDLSSGSSSDPIPTDGYPEAVAAGGGSVWVAQQACPTGSGTGAEEVVRYDMASAQVTARVLIPDARGSLTSIAYGAGGVWVTWGPGDGSGELALIDTTTDTVTARIPLDGRLGDLQVTDAAVWVLDTGPASGALIRIDPKSKTVVDRIPLGDSPSGLAANEDAAWTGVGNGLMRVNVATGATTVIGTTSVAPQPLAVDATGLWFVASDPDTTGAHTLFHLAEASQEVDAQMALPSTLLFAAVDSHDRSLFAVDDQMEGLSISY